ncbi:cyclic di-GMP phosphodiesterase Gmr [mine drainage metagenome]|uniref:Cyclic di-GMP phosphodiesterase Gmr n=1 Tax=mine drainage metagenome TaxID=410659 RepID=A0A1J5S902_9ZZZZ
MTSGNSRISYDEPQTTPDGKQIWLRTSKVPLKDKNNEAVGILGIYEDITDYKLNESNLRIAATAFEAQEGMIVTDATNNILRVNSAFTEITGYTSKDVIGQTPLILNSGRQDKAFYQEMWECLNETGVWEGEIWNRRKSGEVYPEHLTITAVKDASGIVTNYVATLTDITMSKAASDEIKNLAFYDPLTHLPNRRLLMDRLKQALASSTRSGQRGALLFLDLDHFKTLNDTLGHDVGDLLLQQVANRLNNSVREGDTVARIGGDEFVVLLEDLSERATEAAAQTEVISQKILASLNQPYQLGSHEHHSTPSIGVTLFNDHETGLEAIVKQADIAMYQSKTEGRNTLRFFDPKMQEVITTRANMERELRQAIQHQQFQLYYQIQVDSMGHPLGAEALIRWDHPERNMIPPIRFIPLAEETGLILPIGQWVLETACAQLAVWHQYPHSRDLILSINVSAKQFQQADFVAQVKETVQRYGIDPTKLKLELTESMLINDIAGIVEKMNMLSVIGIRFSLDDFGTGYSSLQYLKKLPLSQLKIDQSFVRDIVVDNNDRAIVRTIIAMARSLDLSVIAEGVETEEQRQCLLEKDCMNFQGYLFGKPMPIDEFESLLSKV